MAFPSTEKWIPLGPAQVEIGGVTIDRVNNFRLRDQVLKEEILYDEDGAAPADEQNVGDDVGGEFDIARETWENIASFFSTLVSSGIAPNEIIARQTAVGELDSSIVQAMKVKQYVDGAPDATGYKTFTFPAVAIFQAIDAGWAARGQRFVRVQFRAYKDSNGRYYYLGTPA